MKKSTMVALGLGAGAVACTALAVHFWRKRQTRKSVACGIIGGYTAATAADCAVCTLRKRDADVSRLQVGQKVESAEYVGEMKKKNGNFKVIKNFDFHRNRPPIPVEGIGINTSAAFSLTCTLTNNSLHLFASGWFVGKNLVDSYQLFGEATLVVNGIKVGRQPFVPPDYDYVSKGSPSQTIGGASFFHLFSRKDSVRLILDLWVKIETDSGVNKGFWRYPAKEIAIQ